MLRTEIETSGQIAVVRCAGRIVRGEEAAALRQAVLAQDRECILVVLSDVTAIDAGGLGVLVELEKWAEANHRTLKLLNPTAAVREVLEATRLYSVLDVCSDDAILRSARPGVIVVMPAA